MRIAIVQTEAIKGNIEKNLENHLKWIREAIRHQADMAVFPELSLTGYEPDLAERLATNQDDTRLDDIQCLSDENDITIRMGKKKQGNGTIKNRESSNSKHELEQGDVHACVFALRI